MLDVRLINTIDHKRNIDLVFGLCSKKIVYTNLGTNQTLKCYDQTNDNIVHFGSFGKTDSFTS